MWLRSVIINTKVSLNLPQISNVPLDESRSSTVTMSAVHLEEPWMTNRRMFSSSSGNNNNNNKRHNNNNNNSNRIDENDEMLDYIDLKNEKKQKNFRLVKNYF